MVNNFEDEMNTVFLKSVEVGTKYKFPHWNDSTVGTFGVAIADMVLDRLNYEMELASNTDKLSNDVLVKLMKLSFIFLSRKIELDSENSAEAYNKRASLSQHYSSLLHGQQLDNKEDIISDYYYASIAYARKEKNEMSSKLMRTSISLFLKYTPDSKDNFSKGNLYKSVLEGKDRNNLLYNELLKEYQQDKLELSAEISDRAFWENLNWIRT